MKKILFIILGFILLSISTVAQVPINRTITLQWTASGDDGNIGTASMYDIRYSSDSLLLTGSVLTIGWVNAIQAIGEPIPKISGSAESYTLTIPLTDGIKYYFAIKVADEVGNWSTMSNIVIRLFIDSSPPAAIIDLH